MPWTVSYEVAASAVSMEVTPAAPSETRAVAPTAAGTSASTGAATGAVSWVPLWLSFPALVFRATSLMKSVTMKATSAHGAAYRKTSPTPCPYAASMTRRNGSGSLSRSGMPPPPVPPWPSLAPSGPRSARPSLTYCVTRLPRTAPSAETPIAPPRDRKKVTTELAEPRSSGATWFCVARTRFCIIMPMPRPMTNM
ncbi:hypothetical protein SMICM304S_05385 [Streptomyces microflavus]